MQSTQGGLVPIMSGGAGVGAKKPRRTSQQKAPRTGELGEPGAHEWDHERFVEESLRGYGEVPGMGRSSSIPSMPSIRGHAHTNPCVNSYSTPTFPTPPATMPYPSQHEVPAPPLTSKPPQRAPRTTVPRQQRNSHPNSSTQRHKVPSRRSTQPVYSKEVFVSSPKRKARSKLQEGFIAGNAGPGLSKLAGASMKHAERMLQRRNKTEMRHNKEERQRTLAKKIYEKEIKIKMKREQEVERKKREEMAKLMYERMCAGLRADEMKRYRAAAKKIQKVWRGVMARCMVSRWEAAVLTIQSVVRSHQCREYQKRRRLQEDESRREAIEYAKLNRAARIVQRRVKYMFARNALLRIKRAKELRRWYSARIIQRGWCSYRNAVETEMLRKEEELKLMDLVRQRQVNIAVRKIQKWWVCVKQSEQLRAIKDDMDVKETAATTIQKRWRGIMTRSKVKRLVKLRQTRGKGKDVLIYTSALAIELFFRVSMAKLKVERLKQQKLYKSAAICDDKAAEIIQKNFRCYKARQLTAQLKSCNISLHNKAASIQGAYRMHKAKQLAQQKREEKRKIPAAIVIQQAWRACYTAKKKRETELYHLRKQEEKRKAEKRTCAVIAMQAWVRGNKGRDEARAVRTKWRKKNADVVTIQRTWKGWVARKELRTLRKIAKRVAEQEQVFKEQSKASIIIQKAVRRMLAIKNVQHRRKLHRTAICLQRFFLVVLAKALLNRKKKCRRERKEDSAARKIQRKTRKWLYMCELRRLEAYYNGKRQKKLHEDKRQEAVIAIQSSWRGFQGRNLWRVVKEKHDIRTEAAQLVQRNWLIYRFRGAMEGELASRRKVKLCTENAALTIQVFWRGVLAQEYMQMLREDKEIQIDAAIHMQCWWRRHLAVQETACRRKAKQLIHRKAELEAVNFERSLILAQAAARSIVAQLNRNTRIVAFIEKQITVQHTYAISIQNGAAVAIQACYRGYSDRMFVRGLKREKKEEELAHQRSLEKKDAAVHTMQCFMRVSIAKMRTAEKREEVHERANANTQEDPAEVVQQLFWEMETRTGRAVIKENEERKNKRTKAATTIQCRTRVWLARRVKGSLDEARAQDRKALIIQKAWAVKKERLHEAAENRREAAAVKIQSQQRAMMARATFKKLLHRHNEEVMVELKQEELIDKAVVALQSFWRLVCAKKVAAARAMELYTVRATKKMHESATFIQKVWRGILGRRRAAKISKTQKSLKMEAEHRQLYPANSDFARFGGTQKYSAKERDEAALKIQGWTRQNIARDSLREMRASYTEHREGLMQDEAAVIIQNAWRGR